MPLSRPKLEPKGPPPVFGVRSASAPRYAKDLAFKSQVARTDAVSDFQGSWGRAFSPSVSFVKSAVSTPGKAASDYETLVLETDDFEVIPGCVVDISLTYVLQGIKDMFEHFSFTQTLAIYDGASLVQTLISEVYPFSCSANTGYLSGNWTGDANKSFSDGASAEVPDPFSGPWPVDGLVRARLTLTPATNASGGSNAVEGGTFNASNVKTYFKVARRRVVARVIPPENTVIV